MIRKITLALSFALSLLLAAVAPAAAQFADQATYAGAGGGTANAQTLALANASSYADLVGVVVKYVPTATNTGPASLTVNGFGSSPAFRKPTGSGVGALTGGEIASGQPTYVMYDGTFFNLVSPTSLPVGAGSLQNSALGFDMPVNLRISATVATNALTLAIKGIDGNDPSATNPVIVPFRDVTIASGAPSVVSIAGALSFTINSTSTMGCVSGQMCRLWVVLINNGGTAGLCAFNALSGTSIAPINEAALQTSASGTSGGSSAQTYYCNISAVTAKSIRIVGYVEIQEVTAGTWATGPTYVQLFGPGIKKPGETVQSIYYTTTTPGTTTAASLTTLTTSPSVAIVPTSAANLIRTFTAGTFGSGGGDFVLQIQNGSTLIGVPAKATSGAAVPVSLMARDVPNTTSSVTYSFKGATNTGTVSFPVAGTGMTMEAIEIMSFLPSPANDDGTFDARAVG